MRVLLISTNTAESPYPVYPLGMAAIASALLADAHDVKCLDFLREAKSMDRLREEIQLFAPELIGLSIRNIDNVNTLNEVRFLDTAKEIVRLAHSISTAPVVLGGAGFSIMPLQILEWTGADYGISGEGERLVRDLAGMISRGERPKVRLMEAAPSLHGAGIPPPHYDEEILRFYLMSGRIASVQTKRGCSYSCNYCSYPTIEGSHVRSRSPAAVVDDVERLAGEHGAECIFYTDSVFNDPEGSFLCVISELEKRSVTVPWTAFFRPDRALDYETVTRMKNTGLRVAEIGADCPTNTTLREMNKGFTMEDVRACNAVFESASVATTHYFMFGGPGETEETVLEGISNIKALQKTVCFVFLGIRILPGTPLQQFAIEHGALDSSHTMIEPVYYFSPLIDRTWLEATLAREFAGCRHVVYPPDAADEIVKFLHRRGFSGPLSDIFLKPRQRSRRHAGKELLA